MKSPDYVVDALRTVKVIAEHPDFIPKYQTPGASGADLKACILNGGSITIHPGQRAAVYTGIKIKVREGYEAQVRPRSGLALKQGLTVLNTPGTIDSDYVGEVKVLLYNSSDGMIMINHGDRIAQLVICPVIQAIFSTVENLGETERNPAGFGTTGIK
jgi:dUTP pyrophosphatase